MLDKAEGPDTVRVRTETADGGARRCDSSTQAQQEALKRTIRALKQRGRVDGDEVIEMPTPRVPEPLLFEL